MVDTQKIFLSWSGDVAKAVARVWYSLIDDTFDNVIPFMSEENIGAGERGIDKIARELAGSTFGVIVVTQENQHSQWLNYEAGALSKDLEDRTVRVAPSLVDFEKKSDVVGPMSGFQANLLTEDGVRSILIEIAKSVEADEAKILKRFKLAWDGEYKQRFKTAKDAGSPPKDAERDVKEMVEEILTLVREQSRKGKSIFFPPLAGTDPSAAATVNELLNRVGSTSLKRGVSVIAGQALMDLMNEFGFAVESVAYKQKTPIVVLRNKEELGKQDLADFKNRARAELDLDVLLHSDKSDHCG